MCTPCTNQNKSYSTAFMHSCNQEPSQQAAAGQVACIGTQHTFCKVEMELYALSGLHTESSMS